MNIEDPVFKVKRDMLLKDFLLNECGVSRRLMTKLKRIENGITVNGIHTKVIDYVKTGDEVVLKMEDSKPLAVNPGLFVPKAFENGSLVVYDKPTGMPVHPSMKHQGDTLADSFAADFPGLKFRAVNRLDKDTSGLCLVAKNPYAAAAMQGETEKIYYAVVEGKLSGSSVIDLPIAREKESIIKRVVRVDGKRAVTHYRAIAGNEHFTLLEITLETGRTHQIRVHLSHIGYPLAGDDLYGGSRKYISSQALHCGQLIFADPLTGIQTKVNSEIREDMKRLIT